MRVECHNILPLSLFSQPEFYGDFFLVHGPSWITLIPCGHLSHTQYICCSDAIFQMTVLIQPQCIQYFPCLCNTLTDGGGFVSRVSSDVKCTTNFTVGAHQWLSALATNLPLLFGIIFHSVRQMTYFIIQFHFLTCFQIIVYAIFFCNQFPFIFVICNRTAQFS